jgi:tetratricopeptide (TPR) repeat protein
MNSGGVRSWVARYALGVIVAMLASGCGERASEVAVVPTPDMSTFEPGVRTRLVSARARFDRIAASHPGDEQLGNAYGELGLTYHAQGVSASAQVAYGNAHRLAPADKRWPYLLGQVYADASKMPEAVSAVEATLKIDPNDAPAQIFLGRLYLKQGLPEKARPLFERAMSSSEARAAALTGLGKVALAQGNHREAIERFEEALRLAPAATRLRQPLALAYRGVGDEAKAQQNLRQYTAEGLEPGVPDPALDAVSANVAAYRVLLAKGQYAGSVGRYDLAERAFREAVENDPRNVEAVTNLGIALANLGRIDEAREKLQDAVRLDDANALAHFNLGLVLDRQGRDDLAIKEYELARRDPDNIQARVYLADALMRTGAPAEAATVYREALARSPDSRRIQMSLVKAEQYAEARKMLESASKAQPPNPDVSNALARVLATAPVASVRDGARALAIARSLYEAIKDPVVAETKAMALAENRRFAEAAALQQRTVAELEKTGARSMLPFASETLQLFRSNKPARKGWATDDPAFRPRSPAVRIVATQPASTPR